MLSVFYVPFCTLVVPGVFLTRKFGPNWTLPGYMLAWGALVMINAGVKNFAGTLVVRLCKSNQTMDLKPQSSVHLRRVMPRRWSSTSRPSTLEGI